MLCRVIDVDVKIWNQTSIRYSREEGFAFLLPLEVSLPLEVGLDINSSGSNCYIL